MRVNPLCFCPSFCIKPLFPQRLVLVKNNDDLPIMKQRQRTAFPPNYIHSIDSSHMMLTAIACQEEGALKGRGKRGASGLQPRV